MLLKGKCNYSSPVQKAALGIMLTFLTLYKGILVICLCPPFPPHSPFPMPLRLVWQPYRTACHCLSVPRLFPPLQECSLLSDPHPHPTARLPTSFLRTCLHDKFLLSPPICSDAASSGKLSQISLDMTSPCASSFPPWIVCGICMSISPITQGSSWYSQHRVGCGQAWECLMNQWAQAASQ